VYSEVAVATIDASTTLSGSVACTCPETSTTAPASGREPTVSSVSSGSGGHSLTSLSMRPRAERAQILGDLGQAHLPARELRRHFPKTRERNRL
jgi:hypothetical protein